MLAKSILVAAAWMVIATGVSELIGARRVVAAEAGRRISEFVTVQLGRR